MSHRTRSRRSRATTTRNAIAATRALLDAVEEPELPRAGVTVVPPREPSETPRPHASRS